MSRTYESIASQTLSSSASSVEFTSIPGIYTDLILVLSTLRASGGFTSYVRFNSDSGGNYSGTTIVGGLTGSSGYSSRWSNQTAMFLSNASQPTTTTPDTQITNIFNYANTNVFKTILNSGASGLGGTSGTDCVDRTVGLWRSTSAITSIIVFPSGGNSYAANSTFSIYGIRAE